MLKEIRATPQKNNLIGILYTIIHALAVPLLYVLVKEITKDISSSQAVFFYKFTLLLFITPWLLKTGIASLKTKKIHLHLIRSIISTVASICIMHSLKSIDIIDVTAITYLENVLIVIIGIMVFREPSSFVKFAAIILSCLGVLIVLYPNLLTLSPSNISFDFTKLAEFNKDYMLLLVAVLLQLTNWMIIKIIGHTESNKQQLFYLTFLSSISAFFAAFTQWQSISIMGLNIIAPGEFDFSALSHLELHHLYLIVGMALCYLTHSVSIFKAFQRSEMSTIAPFDYTRLIFSGLYGFLFFQEIPHYSSYVGYTLIVIAGISLIKTEATK